MVYPFKVQDHFLGGDSSIIPREENQLNAQIKGTEGYGRPYNPILPFTSIY